MGKLTLALGVGMVIVGLTGFLLSKSPTGPSEFGGELIGANEPSIQSQSGSVGLILLGLMLCVVGAIYSRAKRVSTEKAQ